MNNPAPATTPLSDPEAPNQLSSILTWPAERFYWATLPPGIIRRDGVLPPGAIELARDQVPAPMERFHAVAVLTSQSSASDNDGRAVVCAIEREALRFLEPGVLTLAPDSIPACVLAQGEDAPDPSRLNLLTGAFEPRVFRIHRHRRIAIMLGTIAISCVAISLDLSRRAGVLRDQAREDSADAQAVLAQASGSGVPDAIALERELEKLRAIASPAGRAPSFDAPRALAEIVGAWPGNTGPGVDGSLPQSLSVRADASTLTVRTPGAPAAFLAAWKTPAGWSSAEPRVQSGVQSNAQGGAEGGLVTLELKQVTPSDTKGGGR